MSQITTKQFLELFPKAKLNIENRQINSILQQFIIKYNYELDKSWQTIGKLLRKHFSENEIFFPKCNDMKPEFWIVRGWDNPREKISELCKNKPLPHTKEYWIKKGFSEADAKIKGLNYYHTSTVKNRLLPTQLEYYTNKGQSPEEAKISLRKEQAKRADKLVQKEKANPELRKRRLWNQIEYYTNKGYSEEIGYQLMSEKFKERNLQTMKKLTQKYLDKGQDKFTALESAQKDYKKRAKKTMKTRIKNKSFGWQKASKQSLEFFKPLMDYLDKENIEYYVGDETHQEYFIANGIEYFYSYDFCIPSKKLIIEYNGEHVHPNTKMSKEDWNDWKHCWTKESADKCREKELVKIEIAKERGFKVIEIYESDKISSKELI